MENLENKNQEKKERSVSIKDLIHNQATIRQLDILGRADQFLKEKKGRYFGGVLTEEEIAILDPEYHKRSSTEER